MPGQTEPTHGPKRRRFLCVILFFSVAFLLAAGLFRHYIKSGSLIARQKPSALETFVARHLIDMSVPDAVKSLKNPLYAGPDGADAAAGRELYKTHCESCHGYDGNGRTAASSGMYPPPLSLSRQALAAHRCTDGELFYFIHNGVRETAMPGWPLPDQQIWQLVVYIRNLPITALPLASLPASSPGLTVQPGHYVGSAACRSCHTAIYDHWKDTLMANVVRDPRVHPDAIIPDLSVSNALVTFSTNDIAFVYGSKWKQRYFKKVGDDYFPLPAQWDVTHKQWRPYFVKDDWWAPFYPPDNAKRPTGPTCDGCHSVNYDISTKTVSEWNVGCERCHGPGGEHAAHPTADNILNPARLDYVQAGDTCIQCHSQGRPLANPVNGQYYD